MTDWKINKSNIQKRDRMISEIKELREHPDSLFINCDNTFGIGNIGIWDLPSTLQLGNMINKELLITNSFNSTLDKYSNIGFMQSLINENIFLFRNNFPMLENYFQLIHYKEVELQKLTGFVI